MNAATAPDYEPKGQYYKITKGDDGIVRMQPVLIPSHVIEQRRREARRKHIERCVARNRDRATRLNIRLIVFYSILIVACCGLCCIYLALQSDVSSRSAHITSLQTQLSDLTSSNDLLQYHLDSKINLNKVKSAAASKGMSQTKKKQIVYYNVQDKDYILTYN